MNRWNKTTQGIVGNNIETTRKEKGGCVTQKRRFLKNNDVEVVPESWSLPRVSLCNDNFGRVWISRSSGGQYQHWKESETGGVRFDPDN